MRGCEPSCVQVIYAEDEPVFWAVAVPCLKQAGVPDSNIHWATDGEQVLDLLSDLQDTDAPLLVILDICMPNMDGMVCAKHIHQRKVDKALSNAPFVVCCATLVDEVSRLSNNSVFQLKLPKPLRKSEVNMCFREMEDWLACEDRDACQCATDAAASPQVSRCSTESSSLTAAPTPAAPTPATATDLEGLALTDIEQVAGGGMSGVVIADEWPVCRLAVKVCLLRTGMVDEGLIREAEDADEVIELIMQMRGGDDRPVLVFLGNPDWLPHIYLQPKGNNLFFISTAPDNGGANFPEPVFNAKLPSPINEDNLRILLEQCSQGAVPAVDPVQCIDGGRQVWAQAACPTRVS